MTQQQAPPQNIKAVTEQGGFEIEWDETHTAFLPFRFLRGRCPCAACVNENTGVRTYDIEDTPEDVAPESLQLSGNYALKIAWNDRHNTGLFTWNYLSQLEKELSRVASHLKFRVD